MKNVRIGGVPEHFNYAWYLALKQGHFKQHNINVRWKDYFGETHAIIVTGLKKCM